MAITIDVQENPKVSSVGKAEADATVINSGETSGVVQYQLQRKDGQGEVVTISSNADVSKYSQVLSVSNIRLKIILPGRQWYQVRTSVNGGAWGAWVSFKTRDKRYASPDSIFQPEYNWDQNPTQKVNKTIIVTNKAKSQVTPTSKGATVVNSDTGYNGTTKVTKTSRGATVITDKFE